MPHSVGEQQSTYGIVTVKAGASCHFALEQGFNIARNAWLQEGLPIEPSRYPRDGPGRPVPRGEIEP